jgi:hypothetical protein
MRRSSSVPNLRRLTLLAALAAALVAPFPVQAVAGRAAEPPPEVQAWQLRWSPEAERDGLGAFEGLEDDRKRSHAGVKHIYVAGNTYRFDMHVRDRDGSDRQRNESKGMRAGGRILDIANGSRWRLTQAMYIPDSLKGTSSFSHIMQLKMPGSGTGPLMAMSLRRDGSREYVEVRAWSAGISIGQADLAPIRNRWLDSELEIVAGDRGSMRWVLRDGDKVLVDQQKANVDIWMGDRLRPKWGIYRSISDRGQLRDTYLLLTRMRAYEWT